MATLLASSVQLQASAARYLDVRAFTEQLCEPLAIEDYVVQSMADVSPTKWHLAHTSWFFETFVLAPHQPGYRPYDPAYAFLFNSYYVQAGERHCRAQRGYISRPTVAEVFAYRRHVDEAMAGLLASSDERLVTRVAALVELGLHHEQQHQELLLTDIKHVFSVNPLRPAYRERSDLPARAVSPFQWLPFEGGVHWLGHEGETFAYDNEGPRHRVWLEPYLLADRLVTNGEYLEFMADGCYRRTELWLSLGWATREQNGWTEPFYWEQRDGEWWHYTLAGMRRVDPHEPLTHISYFEADAFARWAGARLPTEAEWEVAAASVPLTGNFAESGRFHPAAAFALDGPAAGNVAPDAELAPAGPTPPAASARNGRHGPRQLYGDVWEWTQSPYAPYPGFRPAAGAIGEYNGKFMCNQYVLRGGSCATSRSHIRASYRNFFPPEATWQFTGLRLARDP
jgi:ergothioneine biosynthesis protein EgtB